jgi:endoglucanase
MKDLPLLMALFATVLMSCQAPVPSGVPDQHQHIRFNQVGYYPTAVKEFVVADHEATSFMILNEEGEKAFEGTLESKGTWEASGETVMAGNFSGLSKPGNYSIQLNTGRVSAPFEIKPGVYGPALDASIKSFYFQRASMAIEEQHGGTWQRASGHPDDLCIFHPSSGKTEGTLNSPGGWYDAGDYGKYVVNAAITVGQMLNLLEMLPEAIPGDHLNIPESGNGIPDLLDEIRYELDWVMTMQDEDGGVFHKLTALNFGGFIMPEAYDLDRYIIGKGTFSSLTFAAVMAQASRIFAEWDPEFASAALTSAESAWNWAVANPELYFRNPENVFTGQYGDNDSNDDFYWAAAELLISTGKRMYLDYLAANPQAYQHQITNSWMFFIRNMGFHTLLINSGNFKNETARELAGNLKEKHLDLSNEILQKMGSNPYGISIDHFEWGSNSDVLNQSMILCIAHHLSGDQKYLDGAIRNTDYIFGKNATGFSFLTGFGSRQVMNPHHRPSGADGVEAPVPGFILGGSNMHKQDRAEVEYASDFPAKAFEDVEPSYASNEVCLNWNAPAVFVLGYLEETNK